MPKKDSGGSHMWQDFSISLHFCSVDKVSALVSALLLSKTAETLFYKENPVENVAIFSYPLNKTPLFCKD